MGSKTWVNARTRTIVLIAVAIVLLTVAAMLLLPFIGSGASSGLEPSARPTSPKASSSAPPISKPFASPTVTMTSTPTPVASDIAEATPVPPVPSNDPEQSQEPAQPPAAEPEPEPTEESAPEPPAVQIPPRLTGFGWVGSDSVICPDMTSNHVVVKEFTWTADDAATVDLYVAMTDSEVQATSGYEMVASGLSPSGATDIPISCGSSGLGTYFTVRIVATNASGSVAAHWWGATGL